MVKSVLAQQVVIAPQAHASAALFNPFGTSIGNTDMHAWNLSFVGELGTPHTLSPAYDMLSMAFSPSASGMVTNTLPPAQLHASVNGDTWREALALSRQYLIRLGNDVRFSDGFEPCIQALRGHVENASQKINRLVSQETKLLGAYF